MPGRRGLIHRTSYWAYWNYGPWSRPGIPILRYSKILKKGKRPEYDVGRVIVLLQENGKLDDKGLIEIKGIDIYGQFGFDIQKGGDLNNDDIDDVIISAPYAGWDRQGFTKRSVNDLRAEFGVNCHWRFVDSWE